MSGKVQLERFEYWKKVATMTVNGGTMGNVFRTFIEQILVPELSPGTCLVADNLPTHYTNGIKVLSVQPSELPAVVTTSVDLE